jgi:hypothetical protein
MPTLEQWREWHVQCAAARCQAATKEALCLFGWQRFKHYASVCGGAAVGTGALPDAAGCWHLTETRLATGRTRQDKRYKDWLFDRAGGTAATLDAVQGGASLLLRDVVRDFLRREGPRAHHLSLDAPAGEGHTTPALAELLPGAPDVAVDERELGRLARPLAQAFFALLPERDRLVVLARQLGVPLYHPTVESVAGVRKSRVATLWQDVFHRLAACVDERHGDEERSVRLALCLRSAAVLGELIFSWGRLEKTAAGLFILAEGTHAPVQSKSE